MPIFKTNNSKLEPISEKLIKLESDIQKMTEENLEIVFGLKFIASEFRLNSFRIDTLAYDEESKSFVIIEYKRDKNYSVIDQGVAYFSVIDDRKADCVLKYQEVTGNNLKQADFDWQSTRIIFISPSFSEHQKIASNVRDLPIELWEIKLYGDTLASYEKISQTGAEFKIGSVSKSEKVQEITREFKKYSVDEHLEGKPIETIENFHHFGNKIFELGDNITEIAKKNYIAYRNPRINFTSITIYRTKLRISLIISDEAIEDPRKLAKKHPESYGFAKNLKYFEYNQGDDFGYALELITQAYNFNNGRWE